MSYLCQLPNCTGRLYPPWDTRIHEVTWNFTGKFDHAIDPCYFRSWFGLFPPSNDSKLDNPWNNVFVNVETTLECNQFVRRSESGYRIPKIVWSECCHPKKHNDITDCLKILLVGLIVEDKYRNLLSPTCYVCGAADDKVEAKFDHRSSRFEENSPVGKIIIPFITLICQKPNCKSVVKNINDKLFSHMETYYDTSRQCKAPFCQVPVMGNEQFCCYECKSFAVEFIQKKESHVDDAESSLIAELKKRKTITDDD